METVGNGWKHDQAKTCPTRNTLKISVTAQRNFFLNVRRCARGNGWKQSEIAPLLGKKTGLWGCDPPCSTPWDSPRPKQHVAIAGNVGRAEDGGHLVLSCGSSPWRMWKSLGFLGKKNLQKWIFHIYLSLPKGNQWGN
jgi:hypothetical protein